MRIGIWLLFTTISLVPNSWNIKNICWIGEYMHKSVQINYIFSQNSLNANYHKNAYDKDEIINYN